jgi:hypothetical protein
VDDEKVTELTNLTDEMNRARGIYLSAMFNLELMLDTALLTFFEVPLFRKQQLARASLLERCGIAAKIDTLEYILKFTTVDPEPEVFLARLRAANEYRTLLTHASIGLSLKGSDTGLTTIRFHQGQPKTERISPASILSNLPDMVELTRQLSHLARNFHNLERGDQGILPLEPE